MALAEIIKRASKERRQLDHVSWRAVCPRCGLIRNIRGDEVKKKYGDGYMRPENDFECEGARCKGKLKILYRIGEQRAIHLADIRRRT